MDTLINILKRIVGKFRSRKALDWAYDNISATTLIFFFSFSPY
jgi:hypothetical protein